MFTVAIIGTGPAGLMAATQLLKNSSVGTVQITFFEKRKAPARKLLIAGSSGLNITNALPLSEFIEQYTGPKSIWEKVFSQFAPEHWLEQVREFGSETFLGTSGRYFVREMKASRLLRAWIRDLTSQGAQWRMNTEVTGFQKVFPTDPDSKIRLTLQSPSDPLESSADFDRVIFALGGASYEPTEAPLRWIKVFENQGISVVPFQSANVGYHVKWTEKFLAEAEGLPVKTCIFQSKKGTKKGELLITKYGLEGTPIYTFGDTGKCEIDLKPDLTEDEIYLKLVSVKEKMINIRRAKKTLNLGPGALALLFHFAPEETKTDLPAFVRFLKHFPIQLEEPRPLTEAISSSGGIAFSELDDSLTLKKVPGVFAIGEMIDWTAPTGGFLIQGCVSMGAYVGKSLGQELKTLAEK
jgi:uncharacterized flavoprotein (TIGR03862 family)